MASEERRRSLQGKHRRRSLQGKRRSMHRLLERTRSDQGGIFPRSALLAVAWLSVVEASSNQPPPPPPPGSSISSAAAELYQMGDDGGGDFDYDFGRVPPPPVTKTEAAADWGGTSAENQQYPEYYASPYGAQDKARDDASLNGFSGDPMGTGGGTADLRDDTSFEAPINERRDDDFDEGIPPRNSFGRAQPEKERDPFREAQKRTPINYNFPSAAKTKTNGDEFENDDDDDGDNTGGVPAQFASPRTDVVTRYMSTKMGKFSVANSAGAVGGSAAYFIGKSLLPKQYGLLTVTAFSYVYCALGALVFRNSPYGELLRALGLLFVLVLQRTTKIRRSYPTYRYLPAFMGLQARRTAFPPSDNPWSFDASKERERLREDRKRRAAMRRRAMERDGYSPEEIDAMEKRRRINDTNEDEQIAEFSMIYALIAMAFCGSACGGNMPLLPTWMGALAGAGLFSLGTTLPSARGDLCRIMGMRVVAVITELLDIQRDLDIWPKIGVVSSRILDKMLIMDRKHRIRDRVGDLFVWIIDKVRQTSERVQKQQADLKEDDDGRDRRRERPRDRDDRRRPDDRERRGPPPNDRRRYDDDEMDRPRRPPPEMDWRRGPPPSRDDFRRNNHEELPQDEEPLKKKGWFSR